ncbi:MAG TPA: protein-methionine-sulfoxide reductase heme-binding subunit MsrQ [Polyangiaceae bacterium]
MPTAARLSRALKPAVFLACGLPLAKLAFDAWHDHLSANPIAEVMNRLGFWTLFFLVASLAATPMKALFGWTAQMRVRRMVGLFAFFYATLHLSTYLALDQAFDISDIAEDIVKRKFITVGFVAFLLLVPLALTSTDRAVKRLGFRRWKRVHRLAYVAASLGVVHFAWRVKADLLVPAIFGAVLLSLFAARIWTARTKRRASPTSPSFAREPGDGRPPGGGIPA